MHLPSHATRFLVGHDGKYEIVSKDHLETTYNVYYANEVYCVILFRRSEQMKIVNLCCSCEIRYSSMNMNGEREAKDKKRNMEYDILSR